MILQSLILVPLTAGAVNLLLGSESLGRAIIVLAALVHIGLTASLHLAEPAPEWGGLLGVDALGLLFLSIASLLFAAASIYGVGYLRHEQKGPRHDFQDDSTFSNSPETIFISCLLVFLGSMTLVCLTPHLGLLWVGVEATTLASAPLIYFHRQRRSLEAAWKYLMICSVGIAMALLGNILLSASFGAAMGHSAEAPSMRLDDMLRLAPLIEPTWFKAAFIFILIGYGTKMGLAPLHTWLPDAHSESPSLVSAILSGALLNCAFLGILRTQEIAVAAGLAAFGQEMLLVFGLLSMTFAAVFIIGQGDFKRILAYSSVEHMGVLALGVGLGGAAVFGAMLHAVNHSLTKAMLFMIAGNILSAYHTKSSYDARGVCRALPVSGALWIVGFLAIAGSPPFGLFVSEFAILKAAAASGRTGVAAAYLALLAVIFVGMATPVLRMAQGPATPGVKTVRAESGFFVGPPLVLASLVLILGLWAPPPLTALLTQAAGLLGGRQ